MAQPTEVNTQITDAVTQTNVKVLEDAPAQAMAETFDALSHSAGQALEHKEDTPAAE